jgi:hypothetical protein
LTIGCSCNTSGSLVLCGLAIDCALCQHPVKRSPEASRVPGTLRETISMLANISLQAAFLPSRGYRKMPHCSLRTPPDTANDVPMCRIRARRLVGEALYRSRAARQVYRFVRINFVLCYCELEMVVIPPVIFVYTIGLMAQRGMRTLKAHSASSAPAGPTARRRPHKRGYPGGYSVSLSFRSLGRGCQSNFTDMPYLCCYSLPPVSWHPLPCG